MHFNPRTPVGCDPRWICKRAWSSTFQSTHPSGVRRCNAAQSMHTVVFQSTHPSGVRLGDRPVLARATDFNPRTPVGCDPDMSALPEFDEFQSTHPSGVRPLSECSFRTTPYDFNPRTPVGCDSLIRVSYLILILFQSTHPSGVRRYGASSAAYRGYFNPRTPVGCDVP